MLYRHLPLAIAMAALAIGVSPRRRNRAPILCCYPRRPKRPQPTGASARNAGQRIRSPARSTAATRFRAVATRNRVMIGTASQPALTSSSADNGRRATRKRVINFGRFRA